MDFVAKGAWLGAEPFQQEYEFQFGCVLKLSDQFPGLIPHPLCSPNPDTPESGLGELCKDGNEQPGRFWESCQSKIAAEIFISAVRPVIPESSPSFPSEQELRCSIMILKTPNDRASAMSQGKAIAVINYLHW